MDKKKILNSMVLNNIFKNIGKIDYLHNKLKALIDVINKDKTQDETPWVYFQLFYDNYVHYFLNIYNSNYKKTLIKNKDGDIKNIIKKFYNEILKFNKINLQNKEFPQNFGEPKEIDEVINILNNIDIDKLPNKNSAIMICEKLKLGVVGFKSYLESMEEIILIYLNEI